MLRVDVAGLTDAEIREIVAEVCSRYGAVRDVEIVVQVDHRRYLVARVEMSSLTETLLVRKMIGDSMVGSAALIRVGRAPGT